MLDTGLLLSGAVAIGAMWLASRAFRLPWRASEALDRLLLPGIVGLLIGRAVALVLDDPTSLRSVRAFLVVRGGVEFWPGVVGAAAVLAASIRRAGEPMLPTLARLVPVAVVGYAGYEASCVLREGCYGPHAPVGLRPDGIGATMVPLGLAIGAGLVVIATVLARRRRDPPLLTTALAALAVAASRSVASIWLPRLGDELTRAHRESIGVSVVAIAVLLWWQLTSRRVAT